MNHIVNVLCSSHVLILCISTFLLQDKVVWVCRFHSWCKFNCECTRDRFKTVSCPQDERRRIGTPTARARVCYDLFDSLIFNFFSHVLWPISAEICFHPVGHDGVWLRQKGTDSSRTCFPATRRGQTSSAAAEAETHQLHPAGEPEQKTFITDYTACNI